MTNDDDFSGLTNGSGITPTVVSIGDVLAAVRELDKLGRGPVAVKLHPADIERLQLEVIDRAHVDTAKAPIAMPAGAAMRLLGMPVYPDESCARGKPRWVYADEVTRG